MKNITYRRAQNGDSETIKGILEGAFEEYEINLPAGYTFSDIEKLEEVYLNASGEFIVLIKARTIIGFFALLPSSNNQVELKRLYLRATERGRGLGEHLLNLAIKTATQSGYDRMHLETTSQFFQAVALYRKFGFKKNAGAKLTPGHDLGLIIDL
jgi:putative acetyltransferase